MKRLSILFAALLMFGAGCSVNSILPGPQPGPIACTMEAKQCPDGSYVGRTGPKCEFAACPSSPSGPEGRTCAGSGDSSCGPGYECTQECGPPVARDTDPQPGWSCHVKGQPRMCPICLASNTTIATPEGDVNVKDLKIGMNVWSLDSKGNKITSRVAKVSHTATPKTHQVVHLVLSDSRELWVSPDHPTANDAPVRNLVAEDAYDGAIVRSTTLEPYWDSATYDLLPDSDTGYYWANGILLGSTLRK